MILRINRSRPSLAHVRRLVQLLGQGIPVVLPTETQYALACVAFTADAIAKVRAIKGRGPSAPFSVFISGIDDLSRWRIDCPDFSRIFAETYWPGPLTLVLPTANRRFKLLGGDGKSVGIRVTPEPIIAMLLEHLRVPLVATSANPSGQSLEPRDENRWLDSLAQDGGIVWARPRRFVRGRASTVIDCTGKVPRELRAGPITKAMWNAALSRGV
jgi:L-threonylcarbamoyladenylate synthase